MSSKTRNTNNSTKTQTRPAPATTSSAQAQPDSPPAAGVSISNIETASMASAEFKAELLAALRQEMADIFRSELEAAMTQNLSQIKTELQNVKTELAASLAATKADVSKLRGTVTEMEGSLSLYTDDMVALKSKVEKLSAQVITLENRCEDQEGRSRRNNIRIIGLSEQQGPVTPSSVSRLLKVAFDLEKEPVIDRAHRSLNPTPGPGGRPRPVIVRLHYYANCADILQRAKTRQRIRYQDSTISVFPDYTTRTAKARAAFNDIRRELRNIPDTRYGLIYPAILRITTSEGVTKNFTSPGEAAVFVKTLK